MVARQVMDYPEILDVAELRAACADAAVKTSRPSLELCADCDKVDGVKRYTTLEMFTIESNMMASVDRLASEKSHGVDPVHTRRGEISFVAGQVGRCLSRLNPNRFPRRPLLHNRHRL